MRSRDAETQIPGTKHVPVLFVTESIHPSLSSFAARIDVWETFLVKINVHLGSSYQYCVSSHICLYFMAPISVNCLKERGQTSVFSVIQRALTSACPGKKVTLVAFSYTWRGCLPRVTWLPLSPPFTIGKVGAVILTSGVGRGLINVSSWSTCRMQSSM